MKPALMSFICILAVLLLGGCVSRPTAPAYTVAERLEEYGPSARSRLAPQFERAGVLYPPQRVTLIGLKTERELQVYAANIGGGWRFIRNYPILGASGVPGPKLREGDHQVPEGVYPISLLNPNSRHEISMKIGYPNAFDLEQAAREGRANPGSEIMIHGGHSSIGCLAVGDEASADLFVMTADTGMTNVTVILTPVDFRAGKTLSTTNQLPPWTTGLYEQIKNRLSELPLSKSP